MLLARKQCLTKRQQLSWPKKAKDSKEERTNMGLSPWRPRLADIWEISLFIYPRERVKAFFFWFLVFGPCILYTYLSIVTQVTMVTQFYKPSLFFIS